MNTALGRGAANAALPGSGAQGSHAGLETRLFLGHHAASDLNQEPLEAGPQKAQSPQNTAQLQPAGPGNHPVPRVGKRKERNHRTL